MLSIRRPEQEEQEDREERGQGEDAAEGGVD